MRSPSEITRNSHSPLPIRVQNCFDEGAAYYWSHRGSLFSLEKFGQVSWSCECSKTGSDSRFSSLFKKSCDVGSHVCNTNLKNNKFNVMARLKSSWLSQTMMGPTRILSWSECSSNPSQWQYLYTKSNWSISFVLPNGLQKQPAYLGADGKGQANVGNWVPSGSFGSRLDPSSPPPRIPPFPWNSEVGENTFLSHRIIES